MLEGGETLYLYSENIVDSLNSLYIINNQGCSSMHINLS